MVQLHPNAEGRARASSGRGSPARRARTTAAAALVGLVSLPLVTTPAIAAITPVNAPQTIEAFPSIDMVGAANFDGDIVFEVWRNGVQVGTSGAPAPGTLLELNHDGPPCWSGVTPDIIPGDEIRVVQAGETDAAGDPVGQYMTVANIDAEPAIKVALDADGVPNDVVMTGTATTLDGTAALELTHLSAELVQPAWRDNGWRSRALGAVPGLPIPNATTAFQDGDDGVLFYDPVSETNPLGNHWTAVWKNMPEPHASLALDGEQMISYFERDDGLEGSGLTIMDAEDASGPGIGCPAAASDAVVSTAPAAVNAAFAAGTANLRVSGTAYNANAVSLTLDDSSAATAPITVDAVLSNPAALEETTAPVAPVRQTWTATFPQAAVAALAEGDLTISGTFQRVLEKEEQRTSEPDPVTGETTTTTVYTHTATAMPGRDHLLVKDTVVPAAPTAFPGSGRYTSDQNILVSPDDEIEDVVRYRIGADAATTPAPTAASPIIPSPYLVTSSQTVKARSFDRAGNPSAVATFTYEIGAATVPSKPTGVQASVSDSTTAVVDWVPPLSDGGSPITGYEVQVRVGTTIVRTLTGLSATADSAVVDNLTPGTAYNFRVRVRNAVGATLSDQSSTITMPQPNPAPTVTARSPLAGATGVATGANVTATFSEAVTGVSGTTFTLQPTAGGASVGAVVSYNATNRVATLNPNANLASGTQYTATLTAGIRDNGGATLAQDAWTFTTATANPAPTVTGRSPAINSTTAGVATNVTATFSEAVTGVSGTTFTLRPTAGGANVGAVVSYNATNRVATLNPNANLAAGTQYTATLTGGATAIRDAQGAPLTTLSWNFTTASATNVAPTVTARTPAPASTGILRSTNVTATFSEAVNGVSGTTFRLTNATTGAAVTAVVSYNATTRVATLNPSANLAANTRYRATLTGGTSAIRDVQNAPLTTVTWTFTTGAS